MTPDDPVRTAPVHPARTGGDTSDDGRTAEDWSDICINTCGGSCCTHVAWGLRSPLTNDDFNRMRVALLHPAISFFIEEGIWHLHIQSPCRQFQPDGSCGIYAERPDICRAYGPGNCEWPDGLRWELHLETDQQLQDYLHQRWGRVHEIEALDALAVAAVVTWPVEEPFDHRMFDEIRWGALHHHISFFIDADGDWYMLIAAPFVVGGPKAAIGSAVREQWREFLADDTDVISYLRRKHPDCDIPGMTGA